MENDFQPIDEIGREGLIDKLLGFESYSHPDVIKGAGDDAAVFEVSNEKIALLSSEQFTEGIDFDLTYVPLRHLGYKIVSNTVSDIYAMNSIPTGILVNLGLPNKISVQMSESLYEGIYAACQDYEVQLVGGDINASHQVLSIGCSVYGKGEKHNLTYRSGGKVDDAICVTGDLGAALAGLRILMREKEVWKEHEREDVQPDLSDYEFVVRKQLVPKARRDTVEMFHKHGLVPSAMIDVSKGLLHDLYQLTSKGKVGAYLYEQAIPVAVETRQVADEIEEDVDKYSLYGGEDLELVFTMPEKDIERLAKVSKDFAVVGKITSKDEGLKMQRADGYVVEFEIGEHKSEDSSANNGS